MKRFHLLLILCAFFTNAGAQNYDEPKVPAYTLPPLLLTSQKQIVKTSSGWENSRRHEILGLFRNNVYGLLPNTYDDMQFTLTNEVPAAMGGKARLKEVQIEIWKSGKSVKIDLVIFIPNKINRPAAFLLINNRSKDNTDATRMAKSEFWPAEMLIDSGYAIAAFHVSDAAPDDSVTYMNGALRLYPEQLDVKNGMKAIGAWAWAASRVMDYFEEQNVDVDPERIFLVGHSRGGKAALWAGAEDRRFAIVFSNNSGNSGAALSRRRFGETIKAINDRFPHWFCNNYKKFNDNEAALPVDQHMLIALIAPKPVYVTSASKDLWADPKGSYLSLVHAQPVYALYGNHVPLPAKPPPINSPMIRSKLGYHNREGEHNLTSYDWKNFIRFATYHHRHRK